MSDETEEYIDESPCNNCGEPWCDICAYRREQAVAANPCPTCKGSGLNPTETTTNPNELITLDELIQQLEIARDKATEGEWDCTFSMDRTEAMVSSVIDSGVEAIVVSKARAYNAESIVTYHNTAEEVLRHLRLKQRTGEKAKAEAIRMRAECDGLNRWMQTARETAALAVGKIEESRSNARRSRDDAYRVRRELRVCTSELAEHKAKEVDLLADAYDKGRRYNEDEDDRTSEHD